MNGDETEADPDAVFRNVFPLAAVVPRTTCVRLYAINRPTVYTNINFLHLIRYILHGKINTSSDAGKQIVVKRVESCKSDAEIYCRLEKNRNLN